MEKRFWIKKEILTTEKSYLEVLDKIQRIFIAPLLEHNILAKVHINDIFSNLQDIIKVNTELYSQLSDRISIDSDSDTEDHEVADVFIRMSPFLKIYAVYAKNYANAIKVVSEQQRRNSDFLQFLTNALRSPECQGLNFEAFILAPVQRIPRYKLLLQDLLKNTPDTHSDHQKLPHALDSIEQVAQFLNETIRRHEIILEMIRLQKQISGLSEDLIVPGRILLKRGILTKICRKSVKLRALFLFSDALIYASVSSAPSSHIIDDGSYVYHRKFSLDDMRIIEDGSSIGTAIRQSNFVSGGAFTMTSSEGTRDDLIFQVKTPHKSFALICGSVAEKRAWIDSMNAAISNLKSNRSTLRLDSTPSSPPAQDDSYSAPVWIPDNATTHCMECQNEFTLIKRRHHCRSCGRVLCSPCSSRRTVLPSQYEIQRAPLSTSPLVIPFTNMVRVCDNCHTILEAKLMSLKKELLQSSVNEMERPISMEAFSVISSAADKSEELQPTAADSDSDDEFQDAQSEVVRSVPINNAARRQSRFSGEKAQTMVGSWSQRIRKSMYLSSTAVEFHTPKDGFINSRLRRLELLEGPSPRSSPFTEIHDFVRPASMTSVCSAKSQPGETAKPDFFPEVVDRLGEAASRASEKFRSSIRSGISRTRSLSDILGSSQESIRHSVSRRPSIAAFLEDGNEGFLVQEATSFTTVVGNEGQLGDEVKKEQQANKRISLLSVLAEKKRELNLNIQTIRKSVPDNQSALVSPPLRETSPPEVDFDNEVGAQILKSGLMMKRGKKFKTWKVRWMVLTKSELQWYKPEQSFENISLEYVKKEGNANFMNSLRLEECTEVAYASPEEIQLENVLERYSVPQTGIMESFKNSLMKQGEYMRESSFTPFSEFGLFDISKARYPIKLVTPSRILYMLTTTQTERDDWVLILTRAVRDAWNRTKGVETESEVSFNRPDTPPMMNPPETPLPSPPRSPPLQPMTPPPPSAVLPTPISPVDCIFET